MTDTPTIEFRDPPPRRNRGALSPFWQEVVDKCRANPGQWAFVGRHWTSTVGSIKSRRLLAFRGGGFDACSRNITPGGGKGDVYVRYIGDGAA